MFREYVTSMLVLNRLLRMDPDQLRFERRLFCDA
jgi:hypothetical protein